MLRSTLMGRCPCLNETLGFLGLRNPEESLRLSAQAIGKGSRHPGPDENRY